jgi:hypothetical protein
MNTPNTYFKKLTGQARRRVEAAEYEFHARSFGEELARINFLPEHERLHSISEMINLAARNDVELNEPPMGVKR